MSWLDNQSIKIAIGVTCVIVVVYVIPKFFSSRNNNNSEEEEAESIERERLQRLPVGRVTLKQISKYNGLNNSRILVSVCGRIFDLTQSREFYGHGGPYNCFVGGDASFMLGAMSLTKEDKNKTDFEQDGDHQITLSDWISRYRAKYPIVGRLIGFETLCPESWREAGGDEIASNPTKQITLDELSKSENWVSVAGKVFDVRSAQIVYESIYGDFPDAIGNDISYAIAINQFSTNNYNKLSPEIIVEINNDDNDYRQRLIKVYNAFRETYPMVGYIKEYSKVYEFINKKEIKSTDLENTDNNDSNDNNDNNKNNEQKVEEKEEKEVDNATDNNKDKKDKDDKNNPNKNSDEWDMVEKVTENEKSSNNDNAQKDSK